MFNIFIKYSCFSNTALRMRMLKLTVVMIEHLLIMTSTEGVMIATSSYIKSDAFDGELLDEFPTASLVKCLKTCDVDRPLCQASRYNADSRQCQRLANATGGPPVTWLSDGNQTVFQKVPVSTLWLGNCFFYFFSFFMFSEFGFILFNFQITL